MRFPFVPSGKIVWRNDRLGYFFAPLFPAISRHFTKKHKVRLLGKFMEMAAAHRSLVGINDHAVLVWFFHKNIHDSPPLVFKIYFSFYSLHTKKIILIMIL